MATINTVFSITDQMSAPLQNITDAVSNLNKTLGSASQAAVNSGNTAASAVSKATKAHNSFDDTMKKLMTSLKGLASGYKSQGSASQQAANQTNKANDALAKSSDVVKQLESRVKSLAAQYLSFKAVVGGVKSAVNFINEGLESSYETDSFSTQLQNVLDSQGNSGAYDSIVAKAQELADAGMYSQTALIGAAGELATYVTDPEATEGLMDLLTDYAAGMTGGGDIGGDQMVNLATGLGKALAGSYDALTKKGFEFTEAQKAVIKGEATETEKLEALGKGYSEMSEDMQAVTVLQNVVGENWNGLYEAMSNTSEGQAVTQAKNLEDIKEQLASELSPEIASLKSKINSLFPKISSVLPQLVTPIKQLLTAANSGMDFIISKFTVITDFLAKVIEAVTFVVPRFISWGQAVASVATGFLGISTASNSTTHSTSQTVSVTEKLSAIWEKIKDPVNSIVSSVVLLAQSIGSSLLNIIKSIWSVIQAIGTAVTQVAGSFNSAGSATGTVTSGVQGIAIAINGAVTALSYVVQIVASGLTSAISSASAIWQNFFGIVQRFGTAFKVVGATMLGILTAILPVVGTIIGLYVGWQAQVALLAAKEAVFNTVKAIGNTLQLAFNALCAANPAVLIITAIITALAALISIMVIVISNVVSSSQITHSVLGKVVGAVYAAGAYFKNIGASIYNAFQKLIADAWQGIADFINSVINGAGIVKTKVVNNVGTILSTILNGVYTVTSALDKLLGTNYSSGVQSVLDRTNDWANEKWTEKQYVDPTYNYTQMQTVSVADAYEKGAAIGDEWNKKLQSFKDKITSMKSEIDDWNYEEETDTDTDSSSSSSSSSVSLDDEDSDTLDDIADSTSSTASNTSKSSEDLKWLRDIAEAEHIDKYTDQKVTINFKTVSNVNSTTDANEIISIFKTGMQQELNKAKAGI